jgi:hypothetical protein
MPEPLQPSEAAQDTGPAPEWYHARIDALANKLVPKDSYYLTRRHELYGQLSTLTPGIERMLLATIYTALCNRVEV